MTYLLDANAFIEAKNEFYRFTFCPGYWEWILDKNKLGIVYSIDKIFDEITRGNDDLAEWAKSHKELFISETESLPESLSLVSQWASGQNYTPAAISKFFSSGDYYLVAHAHTPKYTLVTRERPDSNSKGRVMIPNACKALEIKFMSPFDMLEKENINLMCK